MIKLYNILREITVNNPSEKPIKVVEEKIFGKPYYRIVEPQIQYLEDSLGNIKDNQFMIEHDIDLENFLKEKNIKYEIYSSNSTVPVLRGRRLLKIPSKYIKIIENK